MVEDEVVDALVSAVTADYPRLSHRYYALKAGWLGLDKLQHWDRNAPLPGDDDRIITWDEARNTRAGRLYRAFRPGTGAIGGRFFDAQLDRRRHAARANPAAPSRTPPCPPCIPIC
jgi:oligoendopeptidase F